MPYRDGHAVLGKLGAGVTGIDFSGPALDVARETARRLRVDARFVESDLYASPDVLAETFDVVYAGVGAICWLPDIARWAETMATFTRPEARSTCARHIL